MENEGLVLLDVYQTPLEIMLIWHDCALPDFIKQTLICHGHLHHNTVIDGSLLVL